MINIIYYRIKEIITMQEFMAQDIINRIKYLGKSIDIMLRGLLDFVHEVRYKMHIIITPLDMKICEQRTY